MELNIQDNRKFFDFLEASGLGSKPVIIGVDGTTGVGKSTLAYCIGCKFGVPVINVDHYVEEISGSYKDAVALKELNKLLTRYKISQRTYVIEGVCLIEVLESIKIIPDILLYYKKYNSRKEWVDEDVCNGNVGEQIMQSLPTLQKAIAKYHNYYKPLEKATCTVYRINAG